MSEQRGSRALRAALAAFLAVPALVVVAATAGATGDGDLVLEKPWRPFGKGASVQTVRLALDVAGRSAYTFQPASTTVTVRAWNLDTLQPRTPALTEPVPAPLRSSTPIAVDERRHLALLAAPAAAEAAPTVRVYAQRGGALARVTEAPTRFPAGYAVQGLAVDAARDRLLLLGAPSANRTVETTGAGVGGVQLDVWSLSALAGGAVTAGYPQPLRVPSHCGQVMTTTYPAAVVPSPDGKRVYFGCLSNRGLVTKLTGPNVTDAGGIAELDLAAAAAGALSALRLRPVPGDFSDGDTLAAPGPRVVLKSNSAQGTTAKVFDVAHGYYVGNVGLDGIAVHAMGVDPRAGRTYYLVNNGLGLFDSATTPVDQGTLYKEFTGPLGLLDRPIEVDARTHRLFIPTADNTASGIDAWVAVIRDRAPATRDGDDGYVPPSLDVPEREGVTQSARSADASATGAEFRLVGGPNSLIFNAGHVDTHGIVTKPGTRWEQFATARGVRLSADEATAEVFTTRQDNATSADLSGNTLAAPQGCADLGFTPVSKTVESAAITCDVARQVATGQVTFAPGRVLVQRAGGDPAALAAVQVRQADVSVETKRTGPTGEVVTTIRSEAEGIDLLGAVRIGRVVATATTVTHGRSGTATWTYERHVEGLTVNGATYCADCTPAEVQQAVNDAFGGRVRVDFPALDRWAAPDGTVARIVDDPYRHIERTTFDDVEEDSFVAPAMEVVAYFDETATSRLVVSLASVATRQAYRIFRVGSDELPTPRPPLPTGPLHGDPPLPTGAPTPFLPGDQTGRPRITASGPPPVLAGGGVVTQLRNGLKVVFRSPGRLAEVAALWSLLALPTYLAARRRLLIDLPFLRRAVEES